MVQYITIDTVFRQALNMEDFLRKQNPENPEMERDRILVCMSFKQWVCQAMYYRLIELEKKNSAQMQLINFDILSKVAIEVK